MTAIHRSRATTLSSNVEGTSLHGGGGDGRFVPALDRKAPVRPRYRHSHDPAADLMPAAEFLGQEPDISAILEDFRDSPFNPARRRVLGRLMGIFAMDYQGARRQERAFLRRLLAARNAKEGYAANCALHLCGCSAAIRRTLALGVAESRFATGPMHGFLGAVQARVAATTFELLGPKAREQIWDLLTVAGSRPELGPIPHADRVLERALILKALAARRHRVGPWSKEGPAAIREIEKFAGLIRGLRRRELAVRTTLRVSDPSELPQTFDNLAPALRAAAIARSEIDPLFAWEERERLGETEQVVFADDDGTATDAVGEAPAVGGNELEKFDALPALDRSPLLDRTRLHQMFAEARAFPEGKPAAHFCDAVADHMVGKELRETRKGYMKEGWEALQQVAFDIPDSKGLEVIRQDARGIYKYEAARAMSALLSRYTGAVYVRRVMSDQLTAGNDPLGQIESALALGLAVPFTVREPRKKFIRAWAVLEARDDLGERVFDLRQPARGSMLELPGRILVSPSLPAEFGDQARTDFYMAPAPLDLMAPPFGLVFPELGIEEGL